jgi:hypothetical protein
MQNGTALPTSHNLASPSHFGTNSNNAQGNREEFHQPLRLSGSKAFVCHCAVCAKVLQNPQMARTLFRWILQVFLCCDLFGAELTQPWHIQKELVLVPQKMRLVPLSHLPKQELPAHSAAKLPMRPTKQRRIIFPSVS